MTQPVPLSHGFRSHLAELGAPRRGESLVVAVSGGLDSVVLLHLLRFTPRLPSLTLHVAHFDHGWREESWEDAAWVAGLCRAWGIPFRLGRPERPERILGETRARVARYDFLKQVREEVGARWILTAHQADDQAETVLFRAFRGTGLKGLRGIPEVREPGLLRPLLPFFREELQGYARSVGLTHREDPTNLSGHGARSVLRRDILPRVEAEVAPGARRALVRLAKLAREWEEGWETVLPILLDRVVAERNDHRIVVARESLLSYHSSIAEAIFRALAEDVGSYLDRAGTRRALEFTIEGTSGSRMDLPGGVTLAREFHRLVLSRAEEKPDDQCLTVEAPEAGTGMLVLGGHDLRVWWGAHPSGSPRLSHLFPLDKLVFPLHLRGRRPGDRIRLPYGTKKLKKLFMEARIPRGLRDRTPILLDGRDRVIWVPGVAHARQMEARAGQEGFFMGMGD
ncbi:MAG: tRNA lysidine(34) synthetase TilS [Gemmatimonadota bacterium]